MPCTMPLPNTEQSSIRLDANTNNTTLGNVCWCCWQMYKRCEKASKHMTDNPIFSHKSWQKPSWHKSFPFWYSIRQQRPLGRHWWNGSQTHDLGGADTLSVLVTNELPPLSKRNNELHCSGHLAGQWQWFSQHVSTATRKRTMKFTIFAAFFLDYCKDLHICKTSIYVTYIYILKVYSDLFSHSYY